MTHLSLPNRFIVRVSCRRPPTDTSPVHSVLPPFSARIDQELNQLPVGLPNYSTIHSAGDSHCDGMHDVAKGTHSIHRAYLGRERLYLQNLPTDIKYMVFKGVC
jgi:hypothetical protein